MKKCIITGAGDYNGIRPEFSADYIIAADGGYDLLKNTSLVPDLVIGDFDSIADCEIPADTEVIKFPPEKDKSDLELAVDEAIRRGFDCFYIYGCLGGRLDHTFANIAVLTAISKRGLTGYLIGVNEIITAVTNKRLLLDSYKSGIISIFPAGESAEGVTLKGLKYPLGNAVLTCDSTLGLSNEFMESQAEIEVKNGTLTVIINF